MNHDRWVNKLKPDDSFETDEKMPEKWRLNKFAIKNSLSVCMEKQLDKILINWAQVLIRIYTYTIRRLIYKFLTISYISECAITTFRRNYIIFLTLSIVYLQHIITL